MKKEILLILSIFTLLISSVSYSQWIEQSSGVPQNLYDIEFYDENTGWAVGDNGTVIKTTNGGENWVFMSNPAFGTGKVLNNLSVVDSTTMYFVGGHSTLIKTTDGGQNWIAIRNGPFGSGNGFVGIYMLNSDTGWVCGGNNSLRTFDSFQSYDSTYIPEVSLNDIYFKDINSGLISSFGKVFKTTNGGINWFTTNVPVGSAIPEFIKISVAENKYVCVIGGIARVFRSTNFAESWSLIDTMANTAIDGIYFLNKDTGFAGGSRNKMFKTTDGGFNWLREKTDTNSLAFISSIWFANDLTGWYTGGIGKIYKTTTGGEILTSVISIQSQVPDEFELYQNYPNPFNPGTKIKFVIPYKKVKNPHVRLSIFNSLGENISDLINEVMTGGIYEVEFNADNLPSGIYYYTLNSGNNIKTKKMILLK